MIRIFETGDLHIGKAYFDKNKHPKGRYLAEKRIEALTSMVERANQEKSDLFVITGDLFDKPNGIAKKYIFRVVKELSKFNGTVLILPGNHDYYPEDMIPDVWQIFMDASEEQDHIVLLSKFEPYELSIGDDEIAIYPAFCQMRTASENNLGWIKELKLKTDDVYRIGIAHGAVEGRTIDTEGKYFLMSESELNAIPMDIWLLGHTHVMFPENLDIDYKKSGRIFNAGTHVQTDVRNNTEGNCFIIEVDKTGDGLASIRAKRFISGNVFFKRFELYINANGGGTELRDTITKAVAGIDANTSVSLKLYGTVSRNEYVARETIYEECLKKFFEYPHPIDKDLMELISSEFIKSEFSELTFPYKLLMKLIEDPKKAQMAYELLVSKECQA